MVDAGVHFVLVPVGSGVHVGAARVLPWDKVLREEEPPPLESRRAPESGPLDGAPPTGRRLRQPVYRPNGSTLRWRYFSPQTQSSSWCEGTALEGQQLPSKQVIGPFSYC